MVRRLRNRQGGFTLIELLIVVAIIGIIAALLIPNFLEALQKAKQKRTVADARNTGTAAMTWLVDQFSAAAAGAQQAQTFDLSEYTTATRQDWIDNLVPQYIQSIPEKDGWKTDYEYYAAFADAGADNFVAIRSLGKDKTADSGTTYTSGSFDPTDYNQDIVWADGFFVRWPEKTSS